MPHVNPTRVLDGRAAFAMVADVSVAVIRVPEWTDAVIDRYLTDLSALAGRTVSKGTITRFLAAVPGSAERRRIAEWLEREGLGGQARVVMLTDSALMRGALTAYSWLVSTETRAFAPADLRPATEWLCRGLDARPDEVERAALGCHALMGVALR